MQKRSFYILLFFCLIIILISLIINRKQSHTNESVQLFTKVDFNKLDTVLIQSKQDILELHYNKQAKQWTVKSLYDYPASYSKLKNVLSTIAGLQAMHTIPDAVQYLERFQLNPIDKEKNTGMQVQFLDPNEQPILSVRLGKLYYRQSNEISSHGSSVSYPSGRYIYDPQNKLIAVVKETFPQLSTNPMDWVDKTLISIHKLETAAWIRGHTIVWRVRRNKENDTLELDDLASGQAADHDRINRLESELSSIDFEHVIPRRLFLTHGKTSYDYDFSENQQLNVRTSSGFIYVLRIGKAKDTAEKITTYPIMLTLQFQPEPLPDGSKNETEVEKKKRQDAHQKAIEAKRKQVTEARKRYRSWIYLIPAAKMENLLAPREALIQSQKP